MHRTLLPLIALVLTLGLGGTAQAGEHEKENPCAAKEAAEANPCAAKVNPCAEKANPCAAKKDLPPVGTDAADAAEKPGGGAGN